MPFFSRRPSKGHRFNSSGHHSDWFRISNVGDYEETITPFRIDEAFDDFDDERTLFTFQSLMPGNSRLAFATGNGLHKPVALAPSVAGIVNQFWELEASGDAFIIKDPVSKLGWTFSQPDNSVVLSSTPSAWQLPCAEGTKRSNLVKVRAISSGGLSAGADWYAGVDNNQVVLKDNHDSSQPIVWLYQRVMGFAL